MNRLHTYQEQMEHLSQDLLLLDKQHNNSLFTLEQIGNVLPAGLLVNDQLGRNLYMNKKSEEKLRYHREEIDLLGEKYASTIIQDENHRKYLQKQYEFFFERNDFTEIHYLYQKVAPKNKEAEWMLTNSKLWKPNNDDLTKRVVVVVCVNEIGECARRIGRVLDDNIYLRKYYKRFAALTKREKEIVALVVLGHNNPQIAERLFISRHTVEQHRKNINRKLEFKTFRELIVFAEVFELI